MVLRSSSNTDEEEATTAALCYALIASHAHAENGKLTLAIIGDWPYSLDLVAAAPLLIESINWDPHVSLVLHVGDIHSGSMPARVPACCLFPLARTLPGTSRSSRCSASSRIRSCGAPLKELASVRNLFFPHPGYTLGGRKKRVLSQAEMDGPAHPTDAQFVENVMWKESHVVFVTLNVPGSNNDGLPWSAPFTDEAARLKEVAERTAADLRWLELAFAWANHDQARAVVIGLQADMWDPAALVSGGDGLSGYTDFVKRLADLCLHFGRPR